MVTSDDLMYQVECYLDGTYTEKGWYVFKGSPSRPYGCFNSGLVTIDVARANLRYLRAKWPKNIYRLVRVVREVVENA